ncbi:hypothetical protein MTO96_014156 [Rhipicephalus appendiculatus]
MDDEEEDSVADGFIVIVTIKKIWWKTHYIVSPNPLATPPRPPSNARSTRRRSPCQAKRCAQWLVVGTSEALGLDGPMVLDFLFMILGMALFSLGPEWLLYKIGFGPKGVIAHSYAAGFQTVVLQGQIQKGGLFARLQRWGMLGLPGPLRIVLAYVGMVPSSSEGNIDKFGTVFYDNKQDHECMTVEPLLSLTSTFPKTREAEVAMDFLRQFFGPLIAFIDLFIFSIQSFLVVEATVGATGEAAVEGITAALTEHTAAATITLKAAEEDTIKAVLVVDGQPAPVDAAFGDTRGIGPDKPSSAAIADAIEQGSSTSSEEAIQGPPLELEEEKIRQEEKARKQKEAEEMRLIEEARRLKQAHEGEARKRKEAARMEEARKHKEQDETKQDDEKQDENKQDEEPVRRRKEKDAKRQDDDEARFWLMEQRIKEREARRLQEAQAMNVEDARHLRDQLMDEDKHACQRLEDRRKEEEEKIRVLKEERKRLDDEIALRRLEEERKLLEAQTVTASTQEAKEAQGVTAKEGTQVIEKTKLVSPITKQIMDVVDNIEKMNTNPERPAMVDASTETVNDTLYKQPQQVRMPEHEVQTVPMRRPVASYIVRRPRSETRLQRLLSFFGLVSPEEPDQEVIEYSFIEPTATWSLYEGQQDRPVRYGEGYQQQRKVSKKTRRQSEYAESPESSDSEESPDELEEKVREDDTRKRRKKCKPQETQAASRKKKSGQRRDVRERAGPPFRKTAEAQLDQMDKLNVITADGAGAATERVPGMGYVEEITEEVMQPQRNIYGQPLGPRLRKMRVVRPLDTVAGSTVLQKGAQPSSTSDWKARQEPAIDEFWSHTNILPSAEQADITRMKETGLQHGFTAQAFYPANVSRGAYRPQSVHFLPRQLQPPLMSRTFGPWNFRQSLPAGYVAAEQAPYFQADFNPSRQPLEQPAHCTHMKRPLSTSMDSVCTCVVKCGDHCIGLGRRKSPFLEPSKASSWSSTSIHKYEDARPFEDTAPIYGESSLRTEGRRLEELKARIRAEEEARLLRSRLRLLEAGRYEEKARFDELRQEEEALRMERQRLQGELDRLRERRQTDQMYQRQDFGIRQLSRFQERLQLLEQERNDARKGSLWTREEQWWSLSSVSSRLFGALMPTSPGKDSVPKAHSVRKAPSIAPRKSKAVASQKPPDESHLEEPANEDPYTTEDFMNQMTGDSDEKPRDATSKTAELDSLRLDDVAEDIVKSKSTDSNNALLRKVREPPMVAVRSKLLKRGTKAAIENFDDGEVKSLEESSAENPLPLPDPVPDSSEKDGHLLQSAPKMNTRIPEKPSRRKETAPRSEITTSTTCNGSVIACNVPMPCADEIAAEKELFEIMETPPQDLFPERSFVSLVSLLTILWIAIVLSTTTYLSPKHKADVPTGTTKVTRSSASSYTQPKTSSSTTTHVPSFYLCDSDYCAKEGNFLKSLLSEADYPCEDFLRTHLSALDTEAKR